MKKDNTGFVQPPWVYSPKEVMDWINATHPDKKEKNRTVLKHHESIKDLTIHFDLAVDHTTLKAKNILQKIRNILTKNPQIQEQFNTVHIAAILLRAFAKAKFRNVETIKLDHTIIYNHPEKQKDIHTIISLLEPYTIKPINTIDLQVTLKDFIQCTATIKIQKIHRKKESSIKIVFKGELQKSLWKPSEKTQCFSVGMNRPDCLT